MNIKKILKNLKLVPSKKLGQNFLNDSQKASKIIRNWKLQKTDNILEIGPGTGSLTEFLISKVNKIVLVEKDLELTNYLKSKFISHSTSNIDIFNEDILKFDCKNKLSHSVFKVLGNLPFSSAIKILQWCFNNKKFFSDLYLSFPDGISNKILDTKKSNFLNLICHSHSIFELKDFIDANFFYPKPKIKTSFIHFQLNSKKSPFNDSEFTNFISIAFQNKRKTLINNFKSFSKLEKIKKFFILNKIPLNIRAEDISLITFVKIYKFSNK